MKILGSVKHFIWKACLNLVPTKANLAKRKIVEDSSCPLCGANKTLIHVIWFCPAAIDVWGEVSNPLRKWALIVDGFYAFWRELVKRGSLLNRELCATICRLLWIRRNSFIFE